MRRRGITKSRAKKLICPNLGARKRCSLHSRLPRKKCTRLATSRHLTAAVLRLPCEHGRSQPSCVLAAPAVIAAVLESAWPKPRCVLPRSPDSYPTRVTERCTVTKLTGLTGTGTTTGNKTLSGQIIPLFKRSRRSRYLSAGPTLSAVAAGVHGHFLTGHTVATHSVLSHYFFHVNALSHHQPLVPSETQRPVGSDVSHVSPAGVAALAGSPLNAGAPSCRITTKSVSTKMRPLHQSTT